MTAHNESTLRDELLDFYNQQGGKESIGLFTLALIILKTTNRDIALKDFAENLGISLTEASILASLPEDLPVEFNIALLEKPEKIWGLYYGDFYKLLRIVDQYSFEDLQTIEESLTLPKEDRYVVHPHISLVNKDNFKNFVGKRILREFSLPDNRTATGFVNDIYDAVVKGVKNIVYKKNPLDNITNMEVVTNTIVDGLSCLVTEKRAIFTLNELPIPKTKTSLTYNLISARVGGRTPNSGHPKGD